MSDDETNGTPKKQRNQHFDPELSAIRKVGICIEGLDKSARERVLGYWWSRNQREQQEAARLEFEANRNLGQLSGMAATGPTRVT